jgi:uncharacterized protein (DUF169 family)
MEIARVMELGLELKNALSLQKPIGLKFCRSLDDIPAKAKRPVRDYKNHMAICQAVNIARTFGATIALTLEDSYCLAGASVFGLLDFPYSFFPHHVRDEECGQIMDAIFEKRDALLPKNEIKAIVISPLDRLLIEPDMIIVYGSSAQVAKIAKSFNWQGETVGSLFFGGLGCSTYVASYAEKKPYFKIAAGGEKVMANTSDYELDICFPADRLEDVLKGIKGTNRMLPYPMICTTMLNEPSVPEDYKITYKDL